jgi:predicted ATPase
MATVQTTIERARASDHAISLCYTLARAACPVALWVGDLAAAERYVSMLLDHAAKLAMAVWQAEGRCFKGMLLIKRGSGDTGLRLLRTALDDLGRTGSVLSYPVFLCGLAEGLAGTGQVAEALAAVEQALEQSESSEGRWCIAELLRVKGDLVLLDNASDANAAAEDCFRQALDWARRQGALSWELRAATSLARMWGKQDRNEEARRLLIPIYERFTEGFATADLKAARSCLGQFDRPH